MILKRLVVPVLLGQVVSRFPAWPGSLAFTAAANLVLKDSISEDMEEALSGKLLRLSVTDLGVHFNFLWSRGGFVAGWHVDAPHLAICATARDFLLLAAGREDPDTLFFNRRLVMEGDTELGVMLKNTIDALEPPLPARLKTAPVRVLSALLQRQGGR